MKTSLMTGVFAVTILSAGICSAADIVIAINSEEIENTLFLTPFATSRRAGLFTYALLVKKVSSSGSLQSQQTGQSLFIPGQRVQLSSMAFSLDDGDRYEIEVSVSDENGEVAKKGVVLPGES